MVKLKFSELSQLATQCQLDFMGFTHEISAESQRKYLQQWQENGYAADLEYMKRSPDLICNPKKLFPELSSIMVFAVNYYSGPIRELKTGHAKVARYAQGRDYHKAIPKRMKAFAEKIKTALNPNFEYRCFSDAVPMLERFYAKKSGLGFIGKNSLLIRPKKGSFCFLAEILCNAKIVEQPLPLVTYSCGSCTKCSSNCPTDAIVEDRVIDANKCISYLTIEKKGVFSDWESKAIGDWVFGCDICQEVCPFNYGSMKNNRENNKQEIWPEFEDSIAPKGQLNLEEVLRIADNDEFLEKFAGSPIMRTKREGLLRNAIAVVSNQNNQTLKSLIKDISKEEKNEVIKEQAKRALNSFY